MEFNEQDIKNAIDFGRDAEAGLIKIDYKSFENPYQQFLNKKRDEINVIKHSEDIVSDEFLYKEKFRFQRLLRFGLWFVIYENQIITFGQYRNDLMEWIDVNYKI